MQATLVSVIKYKLQNLLCSAVCGELGIGDLRAAGSPVGAATLACQAKLKLLCLHLLAQCHSGTARTWTPEKLDFGVRAIEAWLLKWRKHIGLLPLR